MDSYSYVRDTFAVKDALYGSFGGIIIGICSSLHYVTYGRLTGISGILETVFNSTGESKDYWQVPFVCGIYAAAFLFIQFAEGEGSKNGTLDTLPIPSWIYIIGGFLVGFGTRIGSGCTSGHGVCGLSRLSKRSFVGVGSFMVTAVITANLLYGEGGPAVDLSPDWYSCNKVGGWVLFSISIVAAFRQFTRDVFLHWVFGGIFGVGLSLSGMINNKIVIAFLNFNKDWNPVLMFVLTFAVSTFGITYWLRERWNSKPLYAANHSLPKKTDIDWPLIIGELLFGVGWGLTGLCPGPAISVLSVPAIGTIFLPSIWLGMKATTFVNESLQKPSSSPANSAEVDVAAALTNDEAAFPAA
jgi:uncharacterized membrane protein YedE/YeeE